jgi:hypothetical protein
MKHKDALSYFYSMCNLQREDATIKTIHKQEILGRTNRLLPVDMTREA